MRSKQLLSSAVATGLVLPMVASAQFQSGVTKAQIGSGLSDTSISTVIQHVITWGLYTIGGLGILAFIYAGFLYITAGGEESKVGDAKKVMTYAAVGVIVALIGLIAMNTISGAISGNSLSY